MSESHYPFIDFLVREGEELRGRLLWVLASLALFSCVLIGAPSFNDSFMLRLMTWTQAQLLPPGVKLVFLDPIEPMMVAIKLSLILSCLGSLPVLTWHLLAFTAPAFAPGMRAFYVRFTILALLLFLVGVALTGVFMLPLTMKMLLDYGNAAGGTPMLSFSRFYSFSAMVLVAFGLPFETPLVMGFLDRFNLVSTDTMRKYRWKVWGAIIILSQFVTPDPLVTPLIFSGVTILLFEAGLLSGKWI